MIDLIAKARKSGKGKLMFAGIFCGASCVSLLTLSNFISMIWQAYSGDWPRTFGPKVPAFTEKALEVMPHALVIGICVTVVSLLAMLWVFRKFASPDERAYWVAVLAVVNYHAVSSLAGLVLIGFFLLPKVANGA